ncbi:MAG: hypothetical protein D6718_06200 [Acidobacteria bacterium]|nr:MAG: hypothetical protein D6718_06200 [Acidobacteriota bacterium]
MIGSALRRWAGAAIAAAALAAPVLAGTGEGGEAVPVYTNADLPQQPEVSIIGGLDIGCPEAFPPLPAASREECPEPEGQPASPAVVLVPIRERVIGAAGVACPFGGCGLFGRSIFGGPVFRGAPFGRRIDRPRRPEKVHLRDALPAPPGGFVGRPGKHLGRADGKPIVPGPHHPHRRSHRPQPHRRR